MSQSFGKLYFKNMAENIVILTIKYVFKDYKIEILELWKWIFILKRLLVLLKLYSFTFNSVAKCSLKWNDALHFYSLQKQNVFLCFVWGCYNNVENELNDQCHKCQNKNSVLRRYSFSRNSTSSWNYSCAT